MLQWLTAEDKRRLRAGLETLAQIIINNDCDAKDFDISYEKTIIATLQLANSVAIQFLLFIAKNIHNTAIDQK